MPYYFKVLVLKSVLIETGHWFLAMVKGVRVRLHVIEILSSLNIYVKWKSCKRYIYIWKGLFCVFVRTTERNLSWDLGTFFVIDRQIALIFSFYYSLHTRIKSMFILGDSNNFGSEFIIHDFIRNENEVISSLFM